MRAGSSPESWTQGPSRGFVHSHRSQVLRHALDSFFSWLGLTYLLGRPFTNTLILEGTVSSHATSLRPRHVHDDKPSILTSGSRRSGPHCLRASLMSPSSELLISSFLLIIVACFPAIVPSQSAQAASVACCCCHRHTRRPSPKCDMLFAMWP